MTKNKIDKNLKVFSQIQQATLEASASQLNIGMAILFLIGIFIVSTVLIGNTPGAPFIIAAAVIGGYMAINIGANDVANNIGPAVGSRALTMTGALLIAAVFEAAGAIIAGGDVVSTISKGIIEPSFIPSPNIFIFAMMSALLAAALWLNLATWLGAPVSTTHSIVGGVVGAGIAAAGMNAVNWPVMGAIASSWIISPVLGAMIAALFLYFIKRAVLYQEDRIAAARKWVPVLVAIMVGVFAMYLSLKGLKKIWHPSASMVWGVGLVGFAITYVLSRPLVLKASQGMENRKKEVNKLFTIPLIGSAALLSFAHGANDVANAIAPLAAIVSTVTEGTVSAKVDIPLWVMFIGALGISVGLLLFGPKLIRTVGEKITRLDQVRAFCVALSAAITVIAASWLGLPVSSTHIAVGGVFGVGFLREFLANRKRKQKGINWDDTSNLDEKQMRKMMKAEKRRLVRRNYLTSIAAAWVITVPLAAILSGSIFMAMIALSGN
ncbi:MAG: inorganic phosphate transporter [Sphingomonadales bacterium]|nr:inorganic phosphate transporter [Sphingomonadales bacterium]